MYMYIYWVPYLTEQVWVQVSCPNELIIDPRWPCSPSAPRLTDFPAYSKAISRRFRVRFREGGRHQGAERTCSTRAGETEFASRGVKDQIITAIHREMVHRLWCCTCELRASAREDQQSPFTQLGIHWGAQPGLKCSGTTWYISRHLEDAV